MKHGASARFEDVWSRWWHHFVSGAPGRPWAQQATSRNVFRAMFGTLFAAFDFWSLRPRKR